MGEFNLDTSGAVGPMFEMASGRGTGLIPHDFYRWPDLSPFEQGTFNAAARELYERLVREGRTPKAANEAVAFHNWSPTVLERVVKDCREVHEAFSGHPSGGATFWLERQRNDYPISYPPQRLFLNVEGKVCLEDRS